MYTIDDLSYYFGRFEWDCYLIGRGVRLFGDHHFQIDDYEKIKSQIKEVVQEQGVKMIVKHLRTDEKVKMAEIIIYHPTKGKSSLKKLRELEKRTKKREERPLMESIENKIIEGGELTGEERRFKNKLTTEWDKMDAEYGRLYGYDEDSIKRYTEQRDRERKKKQYSES